MSLRLPLDLREPLQRYAASREWSVAHAIIHLIRTHPALADQPPPDHA